MLTLKQFVPQYYCLKCKGCCRFSQQGSAWSPVLLSEEIEDLLKNNFPPAVISKDKRIRSEPYSKENNFICSFFVPEDNTCKIYAFRPFECRLYPFLLKRDDDKIFLALDLRCPFVKENLESQELKEYIQYLTGLFHAPSIIKIIRHNPQVIQIYEDTLNLARIKL